MKKFRALAEMIILQAIEDLTHPKRSFEAVEFFSGNEFLKVARAAGMDSDQVLKMLEYVCKVYQDIKSIRQRHNSQKAGRARTSPRALSAPSLAL